MLGLAASEAALDVPVPPVTPCAWVPVGEAPGGVQETDRLRARRRTRRIKLRRIGRRSRVLHSSGRAARLLLRLLLRFVRIFVAEVIPVWCHLKSPLLCLLR